MPRGAQALELAHAEGGVGADQAAAAVGKLQRQAAVRAAAHLHAGKHLHTGYERLAAAGPVCLDVAAHVDHLCAAALAAHPRHRDAQHAAGLDGFRFEDAVVVLDARPVVDALEVAPGQVPRIVAGLHDIDEVLRERGARTGCQQEAGEGAAQTAQLRADRGGHRHFWAMGGRPRILLQECAGCAEIIPC